VGCIAARGYGKEGSEEDAEKVPSGLHPDNDNDGRVCEQADARTGLIGRQLRSPPYGQRLRAQVITFLNWIDLPR
jgi:hypothetical protein